MTNVYPKAPQNVRMEEIYLREIMKVVNQCVDGRLNSTGEFTCANATTTTTVENILCNANSVVLLSPITALAAGLTGVYVVAGDKTFTVHHSSVGGSSASFRYAIIG